MASTLRCVPFQVYSETIRMLLRQESAFPVKVNPCGKVQRCNSSPLRRITVVRRPRPQAAAQTNETGGFLSGIEDAQESVEPQTELTTYSSTGAVYLPPVSMKNWNLTDQHLLLLSIIACVMGGAVTALFVAAIPTLLAFKRAAEALEKLLEVTREELPGTMAAVRLSGMEISDLTMELSDLGQEISSGVKNSARAVRAAQDGLRRVSNITSLGMRTGPSRVNEAGGGSSSKGSS